jgi:CRP-like cAMP-binding protein
VILAGSVSVERVGSAGDETLGPGSVVGELSVLDGSRRDSTVRPERGPVRVLRIPGTRFRSGLLRRGRVTEWLLGALAGRIRRLSAPLARQR